MTRLARGIRAVISGAVRDAPGGRRVLDAASPDETLYLSSPAGWPVGSSTESGAMRLSAVNRCQELISGSVGKLPIYCIDSSSRERKRHPILYLLTVRPNEAMSPFVMRQMVEGHRLSGGNGYIWIIRDRAGRPAELVPLPWELVQPQRDRRGAVWYGVVHPWTGEPMLLPGDDVIHVKGYSRDGLVGISVLQRAADVITAGRAAQSYAASYYASGGQPSGVLSTDTDLSGTLTRTRADGSTETVSRRQIIREEWEKVHRGPNNGHRIAVLDYGLKYTPIAVSMADAKFVESSAVTVEDIARFYGVPLSKLYAGKQAYNSNEQNAIDYVVSTLHPIVTQYEQEMSYKLLTDSELRAGLRLSINMLAELKGDTSSRAVWYRNMRDVGAFSSNDIRALEDFPAIEGGDVYYASLNYTPLDTFRTASKEKGDGRAGNT